MLSYFVLRYGLRVLLDIHAVQGSQNGFDNSGQVSLQTKAMGILMTGNQAALGLLDEAREQSFLSADGSVKSFAAYFIGDRGQYILTLIRYASDRRMKTDTHKTTFDV